MCCDGPIPINEPDAIRLLSPDFRQTYQKIFDDLKNPTTDPETQARLDRRSKALKDQELKDEKLAVDIAEMNGWNKCPACGHMIEKNTGCDHMVCRCGESFTYKGKSTGYWWPPIPRNRSTSA